MPIVVGAPRSGTTLLRFMLDAHPELAIPPETGFLTLGTTFTTSGNTLREDFFQATVNYPPAAPAWSDFDVAKDAYRAALTEIEPFTVSEGFRTFYRLYAARFGKQRYGDKTPIYCQHLDTIRRVLPEARFIHIIRDGRDVARSLRPMWFSPGAKMDVQAAFWRACVTAAQRAGTGRHDYFELRYEDLVSSPRAVLEQLCAYLELPFHPAMLSYYERTPERLREHKTLYRADGSTVVTHQQRLVQQERTTKPPDASRVFAWKREMSQEERTTFERVAGDLLRELGYET